MNNAQARARVQFADWLKQEHPMLFQRAIAEASKSTLGQETTQQPTKSFWQKFTEAAAGLGTTYLSIKNQQDMMKLNMQRAQQGLPPIDAATAAPVVRTQVDVSPQLAQKLVDTAGEGINKTLLLAGVAIAAGLFLMNR